MAEKQDERDSAGTDVTVTGSTDAEHDEELDALLNSKNSVTNVTIGLVSITYIFLDSNLLDSVY
jgi:hypothetical protein